jgi:uncharacterized protein (TIGR03437 family)
MRKLSNDTGHRVGLLALAGLIGATTFVLEPAGRAFSVVAAHASMVAVQSTGTFTATGNMTTARAGHAATLLPNGKVLITGGWSPTVQGQYDSVASAELYDPSTGTFTATGNMITPRRSHTATLLPDGRVLIVGGFLGGNSLTASAELYDPATGTFTSLGDVSPTTSEGWHTATLLANGKVLIAGLGANARLYDPATGSFANAGTYADPGPGLVGTATLLPDGRVLITGCTAGCGAGVTQLYDPATNTFSLTGGPKPGCGRGICWFVDVNTATLLSDGRVLIVGSDEYDWPADAELYDPSTGLFDSLGNTFAPHEFSTATLLPDGKVLIAGSQLPGGSGDPTVELYDLTTGKFSAAGNMTTARHSHTATLLPNGTLLIAGGNNSWPNPTSRAEVYRPAAPQTGTVTSVSAASFSLLGMASESIAASFGTALATASTGANTLPLPTELAGTTVKVKDSAGTERFAPLFFVSPTQVNYLIPLGTTVGIATITITSGDGAVSTGVAQIKAVTPSLFTANGNGQGVAVALARRFKADGTLSYEEVAQFDAAQNRFIPRPLDLGPESDQVFLLLFGTGIRFRSSLSAVIATIGGADAEVSFAGAQGDYVGLDQVNVLLPRSLSGRGELEVLLTVEAQMANPVRISIK